MTASYQHRSDSAERAQGPASLAVAEPPPSGESAAELIAQLLPGVDAERLVRALHAERAVLGGAVPEETRYDSETEFAARELRRVRAQFVLGESARTLQHAFNNPLTALLAEAQLMELDAMPDDHRAAVSRILELARRLVTLSRRLSGIAGASTDV